MIHSYSQIYNIGHAAIADLLKCDVIVEEKVDGSQISFCKKFDGTLECRSKGAEINMDAPEGMFSRAVDSIKSRTDLLHPGWIYRGEYLQKPKHNTLAYDRVPNGYIIIFDINNGLECFLSPAQKLEEATHIGLECVPIIYAGKILDNETFQSLLDHTSILGGQKIEGVVIKPIRYDLFGKDKKVLMGKCVSPAFKEVHQRTWTKENKSPTQNDIIQLLGDIYTSEARWNKAIQHLKEDGKLEDSLRDIGPLLKEIPEDILKECREEIMDKLFDWAWPQLRRKVTNGFPEFYKKLVSKNPFGACPENPL